MKKKKFMKVVIASVLTLPSIPISMLTCGIFFAIPLTGLMIFLAGIIAIPFNWLDDKKLLGKEFLEGLALFIEVSLALALELWVWALGETIKKTFYKYLNKIKN